MDKDTWKNLSSFEQGLLTAGWLIKSMVQAAAVGIGGALLFLLVCYLVLPTNG